MKPITQEWVDKAEGDWASARREVVVGADPNYDLVCFLCQQCAEKYLKARLQEDSVMFPKTHELEKILNLLLPAYPLWSAMLQALDQLTDYAVNFRYPGQSADEKEAKEAVEYCRGVRETVRLSLEMPL